MRPAFTSLGRGGRRLGAKKGRLPCEKALPAEGIIRRLRDPTLPMGAPVGLISITRSHGRLVAVIHVLLPPPPRSKEGRAGTTW
jgi:hypothetical protein